MIFYYIRHGDPIYEPDSLTCLGKRQAEAIGKRLAYYGVDEIYSSTSERAIQTALPACELMKKEPVLLDFCNECYAWHEFTVEKNEDRLWAFQDEETKRLFADESVLRMGYEWYNHPMLTKFKNGYERIYGKSKELFSLFGYEHVKNAGKYRVNNSNDKRIALFAHQGFGIAFLSVILDIPYPVFANHFDMCHTGMTVIEFKETDGFAIPKVLTLSSDSHLYRESLPLCYNNVVRF